MVSKKRTFMGVLVVAAAMVVAACSGSSSPSGGNSGDNGGGSSGGAPTSSKINTNGTIKVGTTLAPTTLDPGTGNSGADYQYLYFVFDRLLQFNWKTGVLEPMLATSWKFSADKLSLTVDLRHGVKFSDGTPFNAQAVVDYSKQYIKEGDVLNNLQYVTDITATNPYQVVYHLSQQNSQLPYGLADRAGMIPSPAAVAKEGKSFGNHPVGTGPYTFASQTTGSSYSFTRNDSYWNDAKLPRVKNITYKVFSNDTSLVSGIRSGDVNIAVGVFPQDVDTLKPIDKLHIDIGPNTAMSMVYFNGKMKPFNDPRVREAFNLALNRKDIVDAASNGLGKVWTEPVPPGTRGYVKSLDPLWTYNPTKAKKLMAEAGYGNGVKFTCYTYPGLGYNITAPVIISNLKKIGMNIKVITGTPAQVTPYYTKNLAPCYLSGWAGGANPVTTYAGILWSKSYYNAGKTDFGVDKDIEQFYTTYTAAGYEKLFTAINKSQQTNPGYAPLYSNPQVNVYEKNIGGWRTSPFLLDNFQGLYFTS